VNEVRDGWHGDADQNGGSSVSALSSLALHDRSRSSD
jgi:hypothetical protein